MSGPEHLGANQEDLDRILHTSPSLPVGTDPEMTQFIIDHAQDPNTSGNHPGYAFTGIPNFIDATRTIINAIPKDQPIVSLDVGSSVPVYSEHRRSIHFSECSYMAKGFYNKFYQDNEVRQSIKATNPGIWNLVTALNRNRKLPDMQSSALDLLLGSVQEAIYCLTQDESESEAKLKESLRQRFFGNDNPRVYAYPPRLADSSLEVRKGVAPDIVEEKLTLVEALATLLVPTERAIEARKSLKHTDDKKLVDIAKQTEPAGERLATGFLEIFIDQLTTFIKSEDRVRVTRFISSDQADPEDILRSVPMAFSEEVLTSAGLSRAMAGMRDPNRHLHSSFEDVAFKDGSLSVVTAFDSWPRFIEGQNIREQVRDGLTRTLKLLQSGGQAFFFPWFVESQRDNTVDDRHIVPASDLMYGAYDFQIENETLNFSINPVPYELLSRWKLADDVTLASEQYGNHPDIAFYLASLQRRQNRRLRRYS